MISNTTRSGRIRKNLSGEKAYGSFIPADLPPVPEIVVDEAMTRLITRVRELLARLEGEALHIPNMEIFLSMYVRKEALFSSQIEGTQATLDDILDPLLEANANRDVAEASDNVKAVLFALEQLRDPRGLPLCLRLLRETHVVLLEHARGNDKSPGVFRTTQNWIGPTGCTLKSAAYVPPNPEDMMAALHALEAYLHADSPLDPLVRAGLIHYQFETIHPFLDGNGRIGRLLILLFLLDQQVISAPYLYISYFLKLNRTQYYEHLTSVRENGTYEAWLKFFLMAAEAAAKDALETIGRLHALGEATKRALTEGVKGKVRVEKRLAFLAYIEKKPILDIGLTAKELGWSFPTTSKFVKTFVEAGILKEISGRVRGRVFAYDAYLSILRKDTEPLNVAS